GGRGGGARPSPSTGSDRRAGRHGPPRPSPCRRRRPVRGRGGDRRRRRAPGWSWLQWRVPWMQHPRRNRSSVGQVLCDHLPMRAARLVAVLLLLQQRGRVTAREVADELEISERTARRDLEALGLAGIPVYSQAGRGGGWRLVGGARTDLTGLTAAEARALFLVAGPASSGAPAVRSALRKLVGALPEPFRVEAAAAAASLHVDAAAWGRS